MVPALNNLLPASPGEAANADDSHSEHYEASRLGNKRGPNGVLHVKRPITSYNKKTFFCEFCGPEVGASVLVTIEEGIHTGDLSSVGPPAAVVSGSRYRSRQA